MFDSDLNTLVDSNKFETFVIKPDKVQEIRNRIPLICNTVFRIYEYKGIKS